MKKKQSAYQLAKKVAAYLKKKFPYESIDEIHVISKQRIKENPPYGTENSDAAIIWEGGPYEWAIEESFEGIACSNPNILAEPYCGFVLCFHNQ